MRLPGWTLDLKVGSEFQITRPCLIVSPVEMDWHMPDGDRSADYNEGEAFMPRINATGLLSI
jgi:hypothetical protein